MTITEIKFRRFINEGKLRAVVSLTFDGSFAVHDIKISFTRSTASFAMR